MAKNETTLPSNVIHNPSQSRKVGHPAAFPIEIPTFFIKLMSDPRDTVYDPFCGSGTTLAAAKRLGRRWVGSEISPKFAAVARESVGI